MNLSILCALNPHLNSENAAELFGACSGKKRQQVEEILAARFLRPDVRESIRRLPVRVAAEVAHATAAAVLTDVTEPGLQSTSTTTSTSTIAPTLTQDEASSTKPIVLTPPSAPHSTKARVEALSLDRYGVHFTADGEFRDLLEAARALASHRLPAGNMAELMKLALKAFTRETEKRRFAVGRKPRAARAGAGSPAADEQSLSPVECGHDACATAQQADVTPAFSEQRRTCISRHIPAAVAREVYVRDGGGCSFISADGRRCNARGLLEVDHAQPFAVGGAGHGRQFAIALSGA